MKSWMWIIIGLVALAVIYLILQAQAKKRQMELMQLSQAQSGGVVTNAGGSGAGNTVLDWVIALTPLAIAGGSIAASVWGPQSGQNGQEQNGQGENGQGGTGEPQGAMG